MYKNAAKNIVKRAERKALSSKDKRPSVFVAAKAKKQTKQRKYFSENERELQYNLTRYVIGKVGASSLDMRRQRLEILLADLRKVILSLSLVEKKRNQKDREDNLNYYRAMYKDINAFLNNN